MKKLGKVFERKKILKNNFKRKVLKITITIKRSQLAKNQEMESPRNTKKNPSHRKK
jgi:hypothetical protein